MECLPPIINSHKHHSDFDELCAKHHIQGILYYFYNEFRQNQTFKADWLKNWRRNELYQKVLSDIGEKTKELAIPLVTLKGMSLLDTIYTDLGSRFMSDIDLLLPLDKFEQMEQILIEDGYGKNSITKWEANYFKGEYSKFIDEEEVCIELHSKLYYHCKNDFEDFSLVTSSIKNIKKLELHEQLIHLCTHAGFQHTFLNLYWLFDIAFLIERERSNIDASKLLKLATKYKVKNSLTMALQIVRDYFGVEFGEFLKPKAKISADFLWSDNRRSVEYLKVKHLTKDSLLEALKYDINYFLHKTRK